MYRHHNFEEGLNIISRLIAGESLNALSIEFKLDKKRFFNGIFVTKNMVKMVAWDPFVSL